MGRRQPYPVYRRTESDLLVPDWYLEDLIEDALSNARRFVRDVDMDCASLSLSRPGSVVRSPCPFDATPKQVHVSGHTRLSIISNHMYDISDLVESGGFWANHAVRSSALFKVLDVYRAQGFTQVLLLHIKDDERATLWKTGFPAIEEDLIRKARKDFDDDLSLADRRGLPDSQWAMQAPQQFMLEPPTFSHTGYTPLGDNLKDVASFDFRTLDRRIVYIEDAKVFLNDDRRTSDDRYNDALAYAFIDHIDGLCFCMLRSARVDSDGNIEADAVAEPDGTVVRGDLLTGHWASAILDETLERCSSLILRLREEQKISRNRYSGLRMATELDDFRVPMHPDDVYATLYSSVYRATESVRMRLECLDDDRCVTAQLLDEPVRRFGVQKGDMVPLGFQEVAGDIMCLGLADEAC